MSVSNVITDNSSLLILKEIELLKTNVNNLLYFCPSNQQHQNIHSVKDCSGVSIHTVLSILLQDKFSSTQNTLINNNNESPFYTLLNYRESLYNKINELDVPLTSLLEPGLNNNTTLVNWLSNTKISDMRTISHDWYKSTVPPEISLIMLKFYENTLKNYYDKYITAYHKYKHICVEIKKLEQTASEMLKLNTSNP